MAARRAAENVTAQQLDLLRVQHGIVNEMLKDDSSFNIDVFLQANKVFHDTIMQATLSEVIKQTVYKLVSPPIVYQTAQNYSRQDVQRSNEQHLELIEALEEKNADWSEAIMKNHLLAGFRRFKETS